ncbi:MAG: TlpA disulfide reductase family protein [Polyangiales bacterium]
MSRASTVDDDHAQQARGRELWAALLVLCLGAPFVFIFARAMADSELRRREGPLRAMIGDRAFEANAAGEKTDLHYLGDGLRAPDFTLPDKDGKPWRLRDQRGKVVVMNFWTITCQPCVEEMPSLVNLAELAKKRKDFEVVAVTSDKDWAAVAPLFSSRSKLKVLFDPKRSIIKDKFGSKLFPETWVIDGDGIVRLRVDGPRDWGSALSVAAIERFL